MLLKSHTPDFLLFNSRAVIVVDAQVACDASPVHMYLCMYMCMHASTYEMHASTYAYR